jgi:hypothetical protein
MFITPLTLQDPEENQMQAAGALVVEKIDRNVSEFKNDL